MAQLYYTAFTVQGSQVPTTQTDFTVPLKPTDNRFKSVANGGHTVNANSGFDLRPYSDSALTSGLSYKLVPGSYNATTGTFEMWVKVPSLSNGYVIYLGYGDTGLTSDGSSTAAWDSSFKSVFLMNETTGTTVSDVTSNGNSGTASRDTSNWTTASGKIGTGFTAAAASTDKIDALAAKPSATAFTITCWVNIGGTNTNYRTIYAASANGPGLWLKNRLITWYDGNIDGVNDILNGATTLTAGTWYLVTATHNGNGTALKFFLNTASDATSSTNNTFLPTDATTGIFGHGAVAEFFDGTADMLTLSNVERSPDWITTTYNSQNSQSTFFGSLATEVSIGGGAALVTTRRSQFFVFMPGTTR